MARIEFPAFSVDVPNGWGDVTDLVGVEVRTIAHAEGTGALQFSVARYVSGKEPNPTCEDLLEMLTEFGEAHGIGIPSEVDTATSPLMAAGSFCWDDAFLRVWYLTDGRNFVFATYNCPLFKERAELPVCETIVRSLQFR